MPVGGYTQGKYSICLFFSRHGNKGEARKIVWPVGDIF